jgi:hypothetical protein
MTPSEKKTYHWKLRKACHKPLVQGKWHFREDGDIEGPNSPSSIVALEKVAVYPCGPRTQGFLEIENGYEIKFAGGSVKCMKMGMLPAHM